MESVKSFGFISYGYRENELNEIKIILIRVKAQKYAV